MATHRVGIVVFENAEVLDFCGPFEVFSVTRLDEDQRRTTASPFEVVLVAESTRLVRANGGMTVVPDYAFADCPRLDILLVPGGWGTRAQIANTHMRAASSSMPEGRAWPAAAALLLAVAGCSSDSDVGSDSEPPPARENWQRALLHTDLELDLATMTGRAVISVADGEAPGASWAVGGLDIHAVRGADGPLAYRVRDGRLDVGVPDTGAPVAVTIDYGFAAQEAFEGWMADAGLSFLWPAFCSNLFPCRPAPAEGQTYTLAISGVAEGDTAVYPAMIPTPAPAYMPAVAVGSFTELDLGATRDGTRMKVWYPPGADTAAAAGTAHLVAVMDFYEQTYGPYRYGDVAGSVSAAWEAGFGGMEHHPFWHVAADAMDEPEVHAHEAAHGWFGNGVRMACWEDFVLSEGTVSYMAARALGRQGVDIWPEYDCRLQRICHDEQRNTVARPDGCNAITLDEHPLWSQVPYMKGARFFREVAALVGAGPLDAALADFHQRHVGDAARMEELIAELQAAFPSEAMAIAELADGWLRQRACPAIPDRDCPAG